LAEALGVVLALTEEAEPDEVGVAVGEADELVVVLLLKVKFVESMDPQVSWISVLHAVWPVKSIGWSAIQVWKAD